MRITLQQYKENLGLSESKEEWLEHLEELSTDSVCPALCDEGCEVEPDGTCEHGCPSVLLVLGYI